MFISYVAVRAACGDGGLIWLTEATGSGGEHALSIINKLLADEWQCAPSLPFPNESPVAFART
jgi:hypothetical protein